MCPRCDFEFIRPTFKGEGQSRRVLDVAAESYVLLYR